MLAAVVAAGWSLKWVFLHLAIGPILALFLLWFLDFAFQADLGNLRPGIMLEGGMILRQRLFQCSDSLLLRCVWVLRERTPETPYRQTECNALDLYTNAFHWSTSCGFDTVIHING